MEKIKVGIIGAGGYGGCGAVEILLAHPWAEIAVLIDKQDVGRPCLLYTSPSPRD